MARVSLLLLALVLAAVPGGAQPAAKPPANRNVRFGMPGEAKADPDSKDAYLIDRPQYVLSYSDKRKTANWACWLLVKGDVGKVARGSFLPLFAALAHHLNGVTVFKVGEVEVDVYVVGRTADGRYAGVKTKVVET